MLAETDVHPGEYEVILEKLHAGRRPRVLEAYPEVPDVLAALRAARPAARGLLELGLGPRRGASTRPGSTDAFDLVVSSAWAGRPQAAPADLPRTRSRASASRPADVVFVGDTWGPDVEGPRARRA